MRSDVVESHPPQNAENRGSNISYRPGYRVPELDPHRYRTQSSGHKSQVNQFRLTPGGKLGGLQLYSIIQYCGRFAARSVCCKNSTVSPGPLTPGCGLTGLLAFDLVSEFFRLSYLLAGPTCKFTLNHRQWFYFHNVV